MIRLVSLVGLSFLGLSAQFALPLVYGEDSHVVEASPTVSEKIIKIQVRNIKTNPENLKSAWTDSVQGMAYHPNYFFISQREELFRFPHGNTYKKKFKSKHTPRGVKRKSIPGMMWDKGFDHFCDPDIKGDLLYLPLEGKGAKHVLFQVDIHSLNIVGLAEVPQHHIPWIAIHPDTSRLYSSNFTVSPKDPVKVYEEVIVSQNDEVVVDREDSIRDIDSDLKRFKHYPMNPTFKMHKVSNLVVKKNGRPYTIDRVQGGTFIYQGQILVLVSDVDDGGLHFIDAVSGELLHFQKLSFNKKFPSFHELEGVTFIPATESSTNKTIEIDPKDQSKWMVDVQGKIRVLLLNHELFKDKASIIEMDVSVREKMNL